MQISLNHKRKVGFKLLLVDKIRLPHQIAKVATNICGEYLKSSKTENFDLYCHQDHHDTYLNLKVNSSLQ